MASFVLRPRVVLVRGLHIGVAQEGCRLVLRPAAVDDDAGGVGAQVLYLQGAPPGVQQRECGVADESGGLTCRAPDPSTPVRLVDDDGGLSCEAHPCRPEQQITAEAILYGARLSQLEQGSPQWRGKWHVGGQSGLDRLDLVGAGLGVPGEDAADAQPGPGGPQVGDGEADGLAPAQACPRDGQDEEAVLAKWREGGEFGEFLPRREKHRVSGCSSAAALLGAGAPHLARGIERQASLAHLPGQRRTHDGEGLGRTARGNSKGTQVPQPVIQGRAVDEGDLHVADVGVGMVDDVLECVAVVADGVDGDRVQAVVAAVFDVLLDHEGQPPSCTAGLAGGLDP